MLEILIGHAIQIAAVCIGIRCLWRAALGKPMFGNNNKEN